MADDLKKIILNDKIIIEHLTIATNLWTRLQGLIGKKYLPHQEGLFIPQCNQVHMYFMSIPLDIIFLKKQSKDQWIVTKVFPNVKPWRLTPIVSWKSTDTLEVAAGFCLKNSLHPGNRLCIK
jgi:uncharacterized membrane protein (UPF0127 family)